jgi:putative oxidoreductase
MIDVAILLLRIVVGIVIVAHGVPKLFWKRKILDKKWRQDYRFPIGTVLFTGILQTAGGLAIIAGVFTQIAAVVLLLTMLVATYVSIWIHREPFPTTPDGKGWDINFMLIGTLLVLILVGDGGLSLMAWLA